MSFDDLEPRPKPQIVVGADLSRHSVADLEYMLAALGEEIERVKAQIVQKKAHLSAADALFGRKT